MKIPSYTNGAPNFSYCSKVFAQADEAIFDTRLDKGKVPALSGCGPQANTFERF
jgi:hypothetical protein